MADTSPDLKQPAAKGPALTNRPQGSEKSDSAIGKKKLPVTHSINEDLPIIRFDLDLSELPINPGTSLSQPLPSLYHHTGSKHRRPGIPLWVWIALAGGATFFIVLLIVLMAMMW